MIKVLWVEDDHDWWSILPVQAEDYGIELSCYDNWEEAAEVLESRFNSWDAIILDANCFTTREDKLTSGPNTGSFLMSACINMMEIFNRHGHVVPWYIFSAGERSGEARIEDLIKVTNRNWDKRTYYNKTNESKLLLQTIKEQCNMSLEHKLTNDLFPEVFIALDSIPNLGEETRSNLIRLLSIFADDNLSNNDYNDRFICARKVIELIFKHMVTIGILPEYLTDHGSPILLNCNLVLTGEKKEMSWLLERYPNLHTYHEHPIFPKVMGSNLKNIILTCGGGAHANTRDLDNGKLPYELSTYLGNVKNTTFLIRSYALQLCDLIIWYANYLNRC